MQGSFAYQAGISGTVTIPRGATVKAIYAHSTAGGTITIFGGPSITVVAATGLALRFVHDNLVASATQGNTSNTIVFTGTDSYYVEYLGSGYHS